MVSLSSDRQSNVLKNPGTCSGNIISSPKPTSFPLMYATELIMPKNPSNSQNGSQTGLPKLRICLRPSNTFSFNTSPAKSPTLAVDTDSNMEALNDDISLPQPLSVSVSSPTCLAQVASSSSYRNNRRRSKMPTSHSGPSIKKKRRAKYSSDTEDGEGSDKEWTLNSSSKRSSLSKRSLNHEESSPNNASIDVTLNDGIADLDLTSSASFLTKINLKQLINRETFESFPREFQLELCRLLPSCDLLIDEEGNPCLHSTALNNDFLSKALREYPSRVESGEFQPSPSIITHRNTRSGSRRSATSSNGQPDISDTKLSDSGSPHDLTSETTWKQSPSRDSSPIKLNQPSSVTADCRVTLTDVAKDPAYLQGHLSNVDVKWKMEKELDSLPLPDSPCSSVTVALTSCDDVAIIEDYHHPLLMSTEDQKIEAELHGSSQKSGRIHRKRTKKRKSLEQVAHSSMTKLVEINENSHEDLRRKPRLNRQKSKLGESEFPTNSAGSVNTRLCHGPVQLPHHFSVTVRQRVTPISDDEDSRDITSPGSHLSKNIVKERAPTTMKLLEEAAAIVNQGVEGKSGLLGQSLTEDSLSSTTGGVKSEELSPCGSAASCSSSGLASGSHQVHTSSVFMLDTPHAVGGQSTDQYKIHSHNASLLHGKLGQNRDSPLEVIHEVGNSYYGSSPASGSPHSSSDQLNRLSPADHQYLQQLKSTYTMPPPKQTKTLAAMKEKMRVKRLMNQIAKTPLLQQDEMDFMLKPNSSLNRTMSHDESTSQSSTSANPDLENSPKPNTPGSSHGTDTELGSTETNHRELSMLTDSTAEDLSPSNRDKNIFSIITHHLTPPKPSSIIGKDNHPTSSNAKIEKSEDSSLYSRNSNVFDLLSSEVVKSSSYPILEESVVSESVGGKSLPTAPNTSKGALHTHSATSSNSS